MSRSDRISDPNPYRGLIFRNGKAETLQNTAKQKNRMRRMATRVAVAGVLAVAPLTALAVPALAASSEPPTAVAVDRDNHPGNPDDHGNPGDHGDRGPGQPGRDDHRDDHNQPAPAPRLPQLPQLPQLPLPSTGSAG